MMSQYWCMRFKRNRSSHLWKRSSTMYFWLHDQITHTSSSVNHQHSEWPLCCGVGLSYIRCSGPAWEPVRLLLDHSHQSLIKPVYRSSAPWQESQSQSQSGRGVCLRCGSSHPLDERERAFFPLLRWAEVMQEAGGGARWQLSLAHNPVPTRPCQALHTSQEERSSHHRCWLQDNMDPTYFFLLQNPDS